MFPRRAWEQENHAKKKCKLLSGFFEGCRNFMRQNLMVRLWKEGHMYENGHEALLEKEFFIVPSLKYAIIFVEEQINIFEHFLMRYKNDVLSAE